MTTSPERLTEAGRVAFMAFCAPPPGPGDWHALSDTLREAWGRAAAAVLRLAGDTLAREFKADIVREATVKADAAVDEMQGHLLDAIGVVAAYKRERRGL